MAYKRDNPANLDGDNYWSGSYDGSICHGEGKVSNYPQDNSLKEASMEDLKRGYQKGG